MKKEMGYKIVLEGEKEYKEAIDSMKKAVKEFRREVEQLNVVLEKEIELLRKLG